MQASKPKLYEAKGNKEKLPMAKAKKKQITLK